MESDDGGAFGTTTSNEIIAAIVARRRFFAAYEGTLSERRCGLKVRSDRKDWQRHVCRQGLRSFRRMYRLDICSFNRLLEMTRSELETNEKTKAINSCGSAVCPEVRLAMKLRYLAGGSVWDIQSNFEVSTTEFYRSVWSVVEWVRLTDECGIRMKPEPSKRKACRHEFGSSGMCGSCLLYTSPSPRDA